MTTTPVTTTPVAPPSIDLTSPGASSRTWLSWLRGAGLPTPGWGAPRRVLVVAPHPDDETLGPGGSIASWRREGAAVEVVLVTDGEASDPDAGAAARAALGRRRREEGHRAAARLGVDRAAVHALGIPDGHVAEHQPGLAAILGPLARDADLLVTTWRNDGHPDHEACGRAAAAAVAGRTRLAEVLIWAWHWARPGGPEIPWNQVQAAWLTGVDLAAKRAAAAEHRSQVEGGVQAPLPAVAVERWLAGVELVVT